MGNCAGLYIIVAFCHNKLVWLRHVITQIVTVYIRHHITVVFCHNKLCWISYNCGLLPQQQAGVASPCHNTHSDPSATTNCGVASPCHNTYPHTHTLLHTYTYMPL